MTRFGTLVRTGAVLAAVTMVAVITVAPASSGRAAQGSGGWAGRARHWVITTVAGGAGQGVGRGISVNQPCGVAARHGGVYLTEQGGNLVRWVDPDSGVLTTVAAAGPEGFNGAFGGLHSLDGPCAVVLDRAGNLVIAQSYRYGLEVRAARAGVFYGRRMRAGYGYQIGGTALGYPPDAVGVDGHGNLLVTTVAPSGYGDGLGSARVWVLAGVKGKFYGQDMVPGHVYPLAGQDCQGKGMCGAGFGGDGGPAIKATFWLRLLGVTVDGHGNVVIADTGNGRVRVIAARSGRSYGRAMTGGHIYTVAGGGSASLGDGGPATKGELSQPGGVAFDRAGNLVVADTGDQRIRVVAEKAGRFYGRRMSAGHIYSIAGNGTRGYSGDGGPASRARFRQPAALAVDGAGNLAIADQVNNRVRLIATRSGSFYGRKMRAGNIYTIAGNGHPSFSGDGGVATRAQISPGGGAGDLAASANGTFVIGDAANNRVRVVAGRNGYFYGIRMRARHIYTVAGAGVAGFRGDSGLNHPSGVAFDHAGNILVSDAINYRLRVIAVRTGVFYRRHMTAGHIYSLAKINSNGLPVGLAVDSSGNIITTSFSNVLVVAEHTSTFYGRPMTAGKVYTLLPSDGFGLVDVAVDHHDNIVLDSTDTISVIAATTGTFYGIPMKAGQIYTVAGTGTKGEFGEGIPAIKAKLNTIAAVAVDTAGNLLLAAAAEDRVRVIAERSGKFYGVTMTVGDIYTVAGSRKLGHLGGRGGFSGDGGPPLNALLLGPCGIAPYGSGLLVLDDGNSRVREVKS